jgi:hypothetical protein
LHASFQFQHRGFCDITHSENCTSLLIGNPASLLVQTEKPDMFDMLLRNKRCKSLGFKQAIAGNSGDVFPLR